MLEQSCDASLTTIYRRIEELREFELVRERVNVHPNGNHYKTYEANLEHLGVHLTDGKLDVEVKHRDDGPDRFRGIWDAMQGGRD
ncbi:ArsR family transcriptional regulator [Haladaptatus sp. ZSTT2]|uniref:ArsR family transcriptional regulator n=1 Tax=Haladaptatus sp. ZSTT2 TaxID=3120515 RepID=UPI00300EA7DF